jgi:hypothetical protein
VSWLRMPLGRRGNRRSSPPGRGRSLPCRRTSRRPPRGCGLHSPAGRSIRAPGSVQPADRAGGTAGQ